MFSFILSRVTVTDSADAREELSSSRLGLPTRLLCDNVMLLRYLKYLIDLLHCYNCLYCLK